MSAASAAAIAFIVFILALWYFGAHHILLELLDKRTQDVKSELAQAQDLIAQANVFLAECASKHEAATREAEHIIRAARAQAEALAQEKAAQLEDFVKRRTEQAQRKIAQAQTDARKTIQASVSAVAVRAAEHLLRGELGKTHASELVSKSIKEIGARLK